MTTKLFTMLIFIGTLKQAQFNPDKIDKKNLIFSGVKAEFPYSEYLWEIT